MLSWGSSTNSSTNKQANASWSSRKHPLNFMALERVLNLDAVPEGVVVHCPLWGRLRMIHLAVTWPVGNFVSNEEGDDKEIEDIKINAVYV